MSRRLACLVAASVLLTSCSRDSPSPEPESAMSETAPERNAAPLPLEVSVKETASLMQAPEDERPLLIDCREPSEYETVRIDGATLVPLGELSNRMDELGDARDRRIIVHCHHGGRSLKAAQLLRAGGFPQAQSMAGGIDEWATDIEPGMARY